MPTDDRCSAFWPSTSWRPFANRSSWSAKSTTGRGQGPAKSNGCARDSRRRETQTHRAKIQLFYIILGCVSQPVAFLDYSFFWAAESWTSSPWGHEEAARLGSFAFENAPWTPRKYTENDLSTPPHCVLYLWLLYFGVIIRIFLLLYFYVFFIFIFFILFTFLPYLFFYIFRWALGM